MRKVIRLIILLFFCVLLGSEISAQSEHKRPKVGLVLSGGGAKGFAYIGLLKVIQEAGLPIDYIGGSSIGAIIGGMYALGYHPNTIDSLIRMQDWELLLSENLDRKFISFEDKIFHDKYLIDIPVNNFKLALKSSVYDSPHIDVMLNRMFSPAFNISNFDSLQIPFLCIGTDLITGEGVELRNGYLPAAIRASMAIPGYWSPVLYDNHYLVDGGVVNNYPAPQVKAMGADIIIGGDVQSELKQNIDELSSMTTILDQIISFYREDANIIGKSITDVYVRYDMPYGTLDFNQFDSIIAIGEDIARPYLSVFKALADSLNQIEYKPLAEFKTQISDSLLISDVKFEGGKKLRRDFVTGYFEGFKNTYVSWNEIHESINYAYGTRYYKSLFPILRQDSGKINLVMKLEESEQGQVSAGFHYDNNYKGSVLANLTLRNFLGRQSKIFFDFVLGQNPRLKAMYILNNGHLPGFGVDLDFYNFELSRFETKDAINIWNYDNLGGGVFMPIKVRNNFMFRLGLNYNYQQFRQNVSIDTTLRAFEGYAGYGNAYFSFDLDTREKVYFSTKGSVTQLKGKYVVPFRTGWEEVSTDATMLFFRHDKNTRLGKRFILKTGLFLGYTSLGDSPPIQHHFGLGGLNDGNYIENYVPFTGLKFIQSFGLYTEVGRLKIQYKPLKNIYITAMADVGVNEYDISDIQTKNGMLGVGLKLSYSSIIGPIEISTMRSNLNSKPGFFVSVGQWF